ncbi:hypothetical protein ACH4SK_04895 [Streptomyces inhibens]|uniref:hypothetical protein n=1 Tax=Streptomyces inhibens TaxID=2293571 RepID=UPI0037B16FED
MLVESHLNQHFVLSGVVGELEAQLFVDLGLVLGLGLLDDGGEVAVIVAPLSRRAARG